MLPISQHPLLPPQHPLSLYPNPIQIFPPYSPHPFDPFPTPIHPSLAPPFPPLLPYYTTFLKPLPLFSIPSPTYLYYNSHLLTSPTTPPINIPLMNNSSLLIPPSQIPLPLLTLHSFPSLLPHPLPSHPSPHSPSWKNYKGFCIGLWKPENCNHNLLLFDIKVHKSILYYTKIFITAKFTMLAKIMNSLNIYFQV